LTLIDISGIQNFVFATNRLRHAVAGSALVDRLAHFIQETCGTESVVFAAGGNAALRFHNCQAARARMARLSRRVHDEAPGLELSAVHREYPPGGLARAVLDAQIALQQEKLRRRPSVPLLGLGVTAACAETQQPATTFDRENRPIAAAVERRETALNEEWDRWQEVLPQGADSFSLGRGPMCRLRFPMEVGHLGGTRDDRSLLGVVYIDGNGIGRAIAGWLRQQAEAGTPDEDLCQRYQRLSDGLTTLGCDAFKAVVRRVRDAFRYDDGAYNLFSDRRGLGFALHRAGSDLHLPVRPLIMGGDDLTFVCDGRIALDLAVVALRTFHQALLDPIGAVRACAGVAIARTHSPILRVYELAEELCKSAKQEVRKENSQACAFDWHIGFASPTQSLDELRERQYRQENLRLTRRPYFLDGPEPHHTWTWLASVVDDIAATPWLERRSKVKQLPDLARQGPDAVQRALASWRISAPNLTLPGGLPQTGYHGNTTSLVDAIELLDLHLPLEPGG